MSYRDFLLALEADVARQQRELAATAGAEAARLLEEAQRRADTERAAALARLEVELDAERDRLLRRVRREAELALLIDQRRVIDHLRDDAGEALAGQAEAARSARLAALLDEVLALAGEGPVTLIVDPGSQDLCRAHLARAWPAVTPRATVVEATEPRGGVELRDGERVFDNTLPSRLAKAWPDLEPRLAALLFEDRSAAR